MIANDNLAPDTVEALKYLRTGGLGEVFGLADQAGRIGAAKVQMDTPMAKALCLMASAEPAPSEQSRTWFILREPGCVPQLKGPLPPKMVANFLREVMEFRRTAYITVLTLVDGAPIVQDGPECLMVLDGRSMGPARRHMQSSGAAHHDEMIPSAYGPHGDEHLGIEGQ